MSINSVETLEKPKTKIKIKVKPIVFEEKQVIVHCAIPCERGMGMRIWKTTYLVTEEGNKIPLVFWEGISLAPEWTLVTHDGFFRFTLIFKGLPKGCKIFSMVEKIPEPGGFQVKNIQRNKTDVYFVNI